MKKLIILCLLLFLGLLLSACTKSTNQNLNAKAKAEKNLQYLCNLPKVPAEYLKDCENFQKGFNSGLIK